MIRSELVQKIADENPHLYQRDVERIVNTIFEESIEAMATGSKCAASAPSLSKNVMHVLVAIRALVNRFRLKKNTSRSLRQESCFATV